MNESNKTKQRPGRKYQDWKLEAEQVPRDDPEADAHKIRRSLASLIARQIVANLRKPENKQQADGIQEAFGNGRFGSRYTE